MSQRRLHAVLAAWALATAAGCDGSGARGTDRAAPAGDDSARLAAASLPDSVNLGPAIAVAPPAPGVLKDTVVALGTPAITDSMAVAPTATELAQLAAGMVVPVAGVRADQVADTFLEARGSRIHHAIDILAPRGTPVLSATDGRVLKLFTSVAGGLMVYAADSTERFVLLYAHLDGYAPGLMEDMPLRAGQQIGTVGTTGNAAPGTPHLHFGIARTRDVSQWWTGTPVDPLPLLPSR